ncbi:MAG: hypothetical protein RLZZ373_2079 [Pseudomonadota bacterium]|jgi:uncharacterized protein
MKLLLILLTVLAVVWLLRGARRVPPPARRNDAPAEDASRRAVQTLARCAHCGLHLTSADSEQRDGQSYCCAAHRRAGPRAP